MDPCSVLTNFGVRITILNGGTYIVWRPINFQDACSLRVCLAQVEDSGVGSLKTAIKSFRLMKALSMVLFMISSEIAHWLYIPLQPVFSFFFRSERTGWIPPCDSTLSTFGSIGNKFVI